MADKTGIGNAEREPTVQDFWNTMKTIKMMLAVIMCMFVFYSCSIQARLAHLQQLLEKAING
jgi:hypothetical protein